MLRSPVNLSDVAFDVLWKQENLGEYHPVLHVDSPGETTDERAVIERDTTGQLRQAGLDHPDIRDALRLLARAETRMSAWIALTPTETRPVMVAVDQQYAVLAVRDKGFIHLEPDSAAEALAAQLPDVPMGKGNSINVHQTELNGQSSKAISPALALKQLMQQPRRGTAKLYGSPNKFITTIDFPDGRWLVVKYTDDNGHTWVHATPASRQIIADWLKRLA